MRHAAVVCLLLAMLSASARAETRAEKSPAVAVSLSVGVTLAGAGALFVPHNGARFLGVATMFVGPSTGRWYAGESSMSGIGLRVLGAAVAMGGAMIEVQRSCDDDAPCGGPDGGAMVLLASGAALWVASAAADTVHAHRAARRYNARSGLTITPATFATPSSRATGLVVGGTF